MTLCQTDYSEPQQSLLHNMSTPPATVIVSRANSARRTGEGLVLDGTILPDPLTAEALLALFIEPCAFSEDIETQLRTAIRQFAASEALPSAAFLSRLPRSHDPRCNDPRLVATVFAQSSANLYLQAKEPNWLAVRRDRTVALVIPTKKVNS